MSFECRLRALQFLSGPVRNRLLDDGKFYDVFSLHFVRRQDNTEARVAAVKMNRFAEHFTR